MNRAAEHVDAFNRAVTSGDWSTFAERFADDAVMTFVGAPAGPFHGRWAIAAAYQASPPTDTMSLLDTDTDTGTGTDTDADTDAGPDDHAGTRSDKVRFRWTAGGTGTMELGWDAAGLVRRLTVTFD